MKSVLIIGMGRFGHHLCENLLEQNNQIMIVDKNEDAVSDIMDDVTSAIVGDCTKEDVLKSLGVDEFDICFVCIGEDFQSNLEITSLLKELGAKLVVSLSNRTIHTKFLLRNGADEVIHPDKDIAERVAVSYSNDNIFDYIELEEGYSIYEIKAPVMWIDKTLAQSNIRANYNISVIGVKDSDGKLDIMPTANRVIRKDDHLMVISHENNIKKIVK